MQAQRALFHAQRHNLDTLQALRSTYRVMRYGKKLTWKKDWRVFWTMQWKKDLASV